MTDTYTITYTARSTTYNLNAYDVDHGLTLHYLGDQGFGLAPLHRITTRGPLQHGDSDIDFRLDPRILQIPLLIKNESASPKFNSYAIREALLDIFRPQDSGYIEVTTSDGTTTLTRRLDVQVLGGLTFDVDPVDYHVRAVVQMRAADPTWYNPTQSTFTVTNAGFGVTQTITNNGNFIAYPIFEITPPVTNFTVTYITGPAVTSDFTASGSLIVATRMNFAYGQKTFVDISTGVSLLSSIIDVTSFAQFGLNPGANSVTFTGTGRTAATQVLIRWNERYTGL